jgi:hypothetical protein
VLVVVLMTERKHGPPKRAFRGSLLSYDKERSYSVSKEVVNSMLNRDIEEAYE